VGRIRQHYGTGRSSKHAALFDGKDFDLVVAENGTIADRLADQRARDGRDIGDRYRSGIGFVLADMRNVCRRPSSRTNVTRESNTTVWRSTGSGVPRT
jgi:hypothetical protein